MKEIKFRGYTKERGRMYYEDSPYVAFDADVYGFKMFHVGLNGLRTELELMEYIGFKDMDDTYIYAGDLVLYDRNVGRHVDNIVFEVLYDSGKGNYFLDSNSHDLHDIDWNMTKVVGNIYQRKQLIDFNKG